MVTPPDIFARLLKIRRSIDEVLALLSPTQPLPLSQAAVSLTTNSASASEMPTSVQASSKIQATPPIDPPLPQESCHRKPSRFCPPNFELTPKRYADAAVAGLGSKKLIEHEFSIFKDHEFPKPRSDWDKTWRNWCRRTAGWGKVTPVSTPPPVPSYEETKQRLAFLGLGKILKEIP
jgi:hypothetical protein